MNISMSFRVCCIEGGGGLGVYVFFPLLLVYVILEIFIFDNDNKDVHGNYDTHQPS